MTLRRTCLVWLASLAALSQARVYGATMAYTVSMPQPANHLFHVVFRCEGLKGELLDFKMPVWTPGYYRVSDYARNVSNFRAEDGQGRALPWEKATRNVWRVAAGDSAAVVLNYDVYGATTFGAQNFLGENRAYISPPGFYLHVGGHLQQPVSVTFQLPSGWTRVASGLDPVAGKPNTFSAPDFDTFYDCPTLLGNQELKEFEVQGKLHNVAIENVPESVDRSKMLADLKRIVEASTRLIGDIPYRHYTFLMMGTGNGGIEHLNSASISFNGNSLTNENGYRGWLSYVAHEYFHHFNVKRIRPIALGPFDYDNENLTNMLWVSEGLSVYYQDIVMVRAGLTTPTQYLEKMRNSIARFENSPGHRYQSATESSANTWGNSGVGLDRNTTISYYDNGAMLGALLDLQIRNASGNRRSLDDVMRALYRKYYQQKKRGFTDAEFRQECESAAGSPLAEVFEYAATTREMNYAKYFALAGLEVRDTEQDAPGASLGVNAQVLAGKLVVSEVAAGSSAAAAGVAARDELVEVDGVKASPKAVNDMLTARKPGDRVKVKIARNGSTQEVEAVLGKNTKREYQIQPMANPTAAQSAILKDWLRAAQ